MFCFLNKSNLLTPKNQNFPADQTTSTSQTTVFFLKFFFVLFPVKSNLKYDLLSKLKLPNEKLIKAQSNTLHSILHKEASRSRQEKTRKEIYSVKKY